MARYIHDFDIMFCVENDSEDPESVTVDQLLEALQKRVDTIKSNRDEVREAVGHVTTSKL